MSREVLARVANPDELSPLFHFADLDRLTAAGGSVAAADPGYRVETPTEVWGYGASLTLDQASAPQEGDILLAVTAECVRGKVGILVACGSKVIREVWWDEGEGRQLKLLYLSQLPAGSELIIRSADLQGGGAVHLYAVEAFGGFDGQFKPREDYDLHAVTRAPFTPQARRVADFKFGSVTTTESCDLACVMCHFNGPQATKKSKTLSVTQMSTVLEQLPVGEEVWLAATGEFFVNPEAHEHLEVAARLGHNVAILTHGQLLTEERIDRILELGVRKVRISADSIYPAQYAKIRRGGTLQKILDAFAYLKTKKALYPDLQLEASCTLLSNTFDLQKEFEDFWKNKVDRLIFNVEYFDIWKYRRTFGQPTRRVDCDIATYVVPSGHIAPCCAVMVYQHEGDTSWLPHIETHTLKEAYDQLCDMYDDPQSPLAKLCAQCDWWIMWAKNETGDGTGYYRSVDFS